MNVSTKKKGELTMDEKEKLMALEAKRRYAREWRAKNKDRVREANLRYWAKRADREAKEAAKQKEDQDHAE